MAKPIGKSFKSKDTETKKALLAKAKELGIEGVTDKMSKEDIIQAIKEHEGKE